MPLRRLFSTEISRNSSKNPYLLPIQRQSIITRSKASVLVKKLSVKFKRAASTIQDTIKR
jgi:hypothetical protein